MDLPGWQALHAELEPAGLTVVTVCMDVEGAEAARPWVELAEPTHPSLVDVSHALGERLGVVNIPNGTWIDENGSIVRPAEGAWPGPRPVPAGGAAPVPDMPDRIAAIMDHAGRIISDRERYADALRDWVAHGPESRYALSPDEVVARSQPRDRSQAEAAAHFELGQWLHRSGRHDAAVAHFRAAHERQPENWTYKRQAWELESRIGGPFDRFWQGPLPGREAEWPYPGDWLRDVEAIGAEHYYPRFEG